MKTDRLEAVGDISTLLKIANEQSEINERDLFQKIVNSLFKHKEIRFNKEQINAMTSPCVYIFFRGNDALYVGMSKVGIQRVFTPKENISCEDLFKDADEVIMISLKTEEEAREAERYLVRQLLPRYKLYWI